MRINPLINTDSYKASHFLQYPPGTEYVYSYIESRNGGMFDDILFFGLQAFIKEYLLTPIMSEDILEAKEFWNEHGEPFDSSIWEYILNNHHGYLPIKIDALPEGGVYPVGTPLVTIENTDPNCFWLPQFLETQLLRAVWYPSTVATLSFECKKLLLRAHERTSCAPKEIVDFQLHDFGARGVSSAESAILGGMAHLVNFKGTDTSLAIIGARRYYNEQMAAYSVPAAEHSTITSWNREVDAYKNMIDKFGHNFSIVSIVADSYDVFNAVEKIFGEELKVEIDNMNARLVIRPDSGNPIEVISKLLDICWEKFGGYVNQKGFRVLSDKVRILQGDGIDHQSLKSILFSLELKGYSSENIVFGMGGGLLQKVDRDTMRFAQKASAICIHGVWKGIGKDPVTDHSKKSKKGRFCVNSDFSVSQFTSTVGLLNCVFKNGKLTKSFTFKDVRNEKILGNRE